MKKQKSEEVIYGLNASLAVFAKRPSSVIRCYMDKNIKQQLGEQLKILAKQKCAYHLVTKDELDKLTSTPHHEGISLLVRKQPIARPVAAFSKMKKCLLVALTEVQNPHNIGAIARSAAHFGADGLILPENFDPPASSYRVAEGGLEHLTVVNGSARDIIELKDSGFKLVAPSPHKGKALGDFKFPPKAILILGSEGLGLEKEFESKCDHLVNIPGTGKVESLNVSVAAAVLLYSAFSNKSSV
jgi:TrmH RNA methyltransferase